jgi:hypothetical protein
MQARIALLRGITATGITAATGITTRQHAWSGNNGEQSVKHAFPARTGETDHAAKSPLCEVAGFLLHCKA